MVTASDFVNIHEHTEYSCLDGKTKTDELVVRAKELGQVAAGICAHGNSYGIMEFYFEAKKGGIKPILGSEFYFLETDEPVDGKKKRPDSHLTVVVMNNAGLITLNKLTTKAAQRFYYKPFIIKKDLEELNEGLIISSGCFASAISHMH